MDAVRTIGECDAYQVQRAGLRVGRRGSGGRSNRQSPPCSRLLSRVCAAGRGARREPRLPDRSPMYLAHVGCGVSLTEVGHLFERDRTAVSHACGLGNRPLEMVEPVVEIRVVAPILHQVSSTRCRCAKDVGEGMSGNPGDETAGSAALACALG